MAPDDDFLTKELAPRPLAEQAIRALSEQTAQLAAEKTAYELAERIVASIFSKLGVDVTDRDAMKTIRDDLAFLSRVNRGAREIKSVAVKTCVGSVIAGFFTLLVLGFKDWIFQK